MKITNRQLRQIIRESLSRGDMIHEAEVSDEILGQIVSDQLESDPEALSDMMSSDPSIMKSVAKHFEDNPDDVPEEVLNIASTAAAGEDDSSKSSVNMFEASGFPVRDRDIGDIILQVIDEAPGINGDALARTVVEVYNHEYRFGPEQPPAAKEEVFSILDDLVEEGEVFFDTQEDAWYVIGTPEAESIMSTMILESSLSAPFVWKDDEYTVTERKPSRHKGVQNGMPMELVIWKTVDIDRGTPGMGSMDIPQGMDLQEFFEAGEKEGFPDYYRKPETGADMNSSIKAAEERGDWDDSRRVEGKQIKITKRQLRKIIREAMPDGGVPDVLGAMGGGRFQPRQIGPTVPDDMMNRISMLQRGDLQDHLYDIVDAIESGDPDYTLNMLKLNLEDSERMDN